MLSIQLAECIYCNHLRGYVANPSLFINLITITKLRKNYKSRHSSSCHFLNWLCHIFLPCPHILLVIFFSYSSTRCMEKKTEFTTRQNSKIILIYGLLDSKHKRGIYYYYYYYYYYIKRRIL